MNKMDEEYKGTELKTWFVVLIEVLLVCWGLGWL
jgi:hypothetical protein